MPAHTAPSSEPTGLRMLCAVCGAALVLLLAGCASEGAEPAEPPAEPAEETTEPPNGGEEAEEEDVADGEERWKLQEGGSGRYHNLIINFAGGADGRVSVEVFGETVDGAEIEGEFIGGRAGESTEIGGYIVTFEEVDLEASPAYAWLSVVPAEE